MYIVLFMCRQYLFQMNALQNWVEIFPEYEISIVSFPSSVCRLYDLWRKYTHTHYRWNMNRWFTHPFYGGHGLENVVNFSNLLRYTLLFAKQIEANFWYHFKAIFERKINNFFYLMILVSKYSCVQLRAFQLQLLVHCTPAKYVNFERPRITIVFAPPIKLKLHNW